MALQNLPPPPNTRLVDEPTRDSVWRRWFEQFFNLVQEFNGGGVVGPGASTDNAVARWDGATGQQLKNSGVIIDNSNNVSGVVNLTATGNLQIDGNTTLGDASADTLTINSGTWTIGSNYVATRALGVAAAGGQVLQEWDATFSGNVSGNSDVSVNRHTSNVSGSENLSAVRLFFPEFNVSTSAGTLTTANLERSAFILSGAGNVTGASVYNLSFSITGAGSITTGILYDGFLSTMSGGSISTLIGFRAQNLGHATLVGSAVGFQANNMTAAATLTASFRSQQNSGTGVWGFLHSGTANNAFNGNVRIGSNVAPTVALDVTGSAIISGDTTLGDASGDAVTVNASTGSVPNGLQLSRTVTSIAGSLFGLQIVNTNQATSSSAATVFGCIYDAVHDSSQTIGTIRGSFGRARALAGGTGTVTVANAVTGRFDWAGTANVGTATAFTTLITLDAAATITDLIGYDNGVVTNGGGASVSTLACFDTRAQTVGTTIYGYRGRIGSGAGKWNAFFDGTANNALAGNVRIGSTVAPTVALDVTGFGIYSGNVSAAAFIPTSSAIPTHGLYNSALNEISLSTVSTKGLTLTSTRSLYGTAIHNNAGPVTGTANQYIASGTYTPTISSIANLTGTTTFQAQWIRVGNVVKVSGKVQVDPIGATSTTALGFSLPIASNFGAEEDCAGTAFASGIAGQGAAIRAQVTNDQAEMVWISGDVSVQPMYYLYQYEVL